MRGIETALLIWRDVNRGHFASEAIRKRTADLPDAERTLAATLVYAALRRASLWRYMAKKMTGRSLGNLKPETGDAIVMGIAGVTELRNFESGPLVNALVDYVKRRKSPKDAGMVNAVLRRAGSEGPAMLKKMLKSKNPKDQALARGVPGWAVAIWENAWGREETGKLVRLVSMKAFVSLRVSPGVDRTETVSDLVAGGLRAWESALVPDSIRLASSLHPPDLRAFRQGAVTPQSESSMILGRIAASVAPKGMFLDMCCGRGIKTGQIAGSLPDTEIEAWDLSEGRMAAARREMARLGMPEDRVFFKRGNALKLEPRRTPDTILLDAPCSGSGTWARHPDGRWRLTSDRIANMQSQQQALLNRAAEIIGPGGVIVYATCSLFRQENEQVVASVLERDRNLIEMPLGNTYHYVRRGRPWGYYIWPGLPWLDGFYMAVLIKRSREENLCRNCSR
ncbi:MAG: RsmB/NOP family class I SAM-dependent RNA methyltransferase [Synergistota bacterium]|nr:RsmB/NOP family class I SAM-dependent RNA methyltransferase [Synergistota bacterium]